MLSSGLFVHTFPSCGISPAATRRRRSATVLGVVLLALVASVPALAQVTIDNDLPTSTLGFWSVELNDGSESTFGQITAQRVASADVIEATDVIFQYFSYVDPGNDGGAIRLSTVTTTSAFLSGDDEVTSSGSFTGANANTIDWTAVSSIASGSPTMTTVFTFTAETGTLGILRFHQYLDEDVQGVGDDVLFSRGSAAGSDLELFTVDNAEVYGVSHAGAYIGAQGLVGATFAGWAADQYSQLLAAIVGPGAPVSTGGVIDTTDLPPFVHPVVGPAYGPEDITSTLAWDLDAGATTATIITTLGGVAEAPPPEGGPGVPEIPALTGWGLGLLALLLGALALWRLRS